MRDCVWCLMEKGTDRFPRAGNEEVYNSLARSILYYTKGFTKSVSSLGLSTASLLRTSWWAGVGESCRSLEMSSMLGRELSRKGGVRCGWDGWIRMIELLSLGDMEGMV